MDQKVHRINHLSDWHEGINSTVGINNSTKYFETVRKIKSAVIGFESYEIRKTKKLKTILTLSGCVLDEHEVNGKSGMRPDKILHICWNAFYVQPSLQIK